MLFLRDVLEQESEEEDEEDSEQIENLDADPNFDISSHSQPQDEDEEENQVDEDVVDEIDENALLHIDCDCEEHEEEMKAHPLNQSMDKEANAEVETVLSNANLSSNNMEKSSNQSNVKSAETEIIEILKNSQHIKIYDSSTVLPTFLRSRLARVPGGAPWSRVGWPRVPDRDYDPPRKIPRYHAVKVHDLNKPTEEFDGKFVKKSYI